VPSLEIGVLGGFRVERADTGWLACEWPRRSAKTLTKLLATCPSHALHREQVIEILWPRADLDSALNSFGKALHAARHVLEPELPPRGCSRYLRLTDSMVRLDTQHVVIDADRFERLAEDALRRREIAGYETALAAYAGELLPEDRYEDWCADRRAALAELRVRLLIGLADALENRGAFVESADRLREVVGEDPTREDVHRRLIRLWAEMGNRDQAIRQFHICVEALQRELGLRPQQESITLYREVLANRVQARAPRSERDEIDPRPPVLDPLRQEAPFVGRKQVLEYLLALLERAQGRPPMIVVSGEAGLGKTRLLDALAREARHKATVLRGDVGAHVSHLPYGPIAVALESFVATRSESERRELARLYPALAHFVPSLVLDDLSPSRETARVDHLDFLLATVRVLSDLASKRPVLLVVDDLHEADPVSLDALRYFAHLARQRRWLLAAAVREEELQPGSGVARALESMVRDGLCERLDLPCLSRVESDALVRALSGGEQTDDDVRRHIYARSGGNPLFIEALLEHARDQHPPFLANGSSRAGSEAPPRIRSLVISQLRAIDDTVQRMLALAAAAETPEISLNRLVTAAGALESPIHPAALFDALDTALSLRILEEGEHGYTFRHPLVRLTLYGELSKHRRQELRSALERPDRQQRRQLRVTAARS
jgi:DNA-binding SARP family transcriptional activator